MVRESDLQGKRPSLVRFWVADFFFIVPTLPIIVKYFNNSSKVS